VSADERGRDGGAALGGARVLVRRDREPVEHLVRVSFRIRVRIRVRVRVRVRVS